MGLHPLVTSAKEPASTLVYAEKSWASLSKGYNEQECLSGCFKSETVGGKDSLSNVTNVGAKCWPLNEKVLDC